MCTRHCASRMTVTERAALMVYSALAVVALVLVHGH